MQDKWQSSTLNCYEDPGHCLICRFINGDRSEEVMMAVIKQLDRTLADKENAFKFLLETKI